MGERLAVDVLVVGSGASGLAAAVSAERAGARVALATKGSLQSCNSAKAQGGIQAAFGDDDSPEQHAEDVWRVVARDGRPAARRGAHGEAPAAIHWLEELGVEFTRENGGYRLARCGGATRKRLLQVGDRTGHAITKALRDAFEARARRRRFAEAPARRARADRERLARDVLRRARARSTRRRSSSPPAAAATARREERGELSTNHPGATGEVTQIALELGAEARDLDALQYHPNGGAWPPNDAGLLDPRDDARVRRGAPERRRRGVHRLARPARRRLAGDLRRGRRRAAASRRPTAARRSTSTRRASPRHDAEISLPYMLRRYRGGGHRPAARADPHVSRAPLPERRPRDRRATPRRRSRASTPAARSPAARTGATG